MHQHLIDNISHLIRMSEEEKEWISSKFIAKQFNKGDYFLREGQICREVGFIESGLVRYVITKENGEELTTSFNKELEYTCNYESFLDHSPTKASIQCIEPSVILTISYDDLQALYTHVKEGEKFGRLACEYQYVLAIRQLGSLYKQDPEQRYLQFLETYPDLVQRLPQYYISSFVGVKPPSLSRIRKRLAK
ncbi:MAG: Crp/Fnr family transcriptional regulator [Chitinophaga sp.]|uniref:Crp/Fnr family transcriptional regulator n=1 Tax=Chitinophaga sp. TaxID=1869181 RepID=UPI0025C41B87|nr:Crp/Fnr family transcriptional regulator [Chitinophaga sp.]MBV8252383.1 Crp/Fnr family transcriptional regulator [Chitinophaga sp.]